MSKQLMMVLGALALTGCEEIAALNPDGGASEPSTDPTAVGGERVPWCHQGDIHDSPTIEWDAAELASMMALYGTDTWSSPDISVAHGTTDAYCADVYSLGALQGSGVMIVSTSPSSNSYGEAQGGLGPLTLPSNYALTDGLTFACEMCGYHPLKELEEEPVEVEPLPGVAQGMTWLRKDVDPVTGVVTVGCDNDAQCDSIDGDTDCNVALPLLCFADYGLPEPVSSPGINQYYTWSGGVVATTPPVAPALDGIATLTDADALCAAEFGADFRAAEFHEGWGWNFLAYGNVGDDPRFWVNIDDQANATCWTQD